MIDHAIFVHADGRLREALEPDEIGHRGVVVGGRLSELAGARQILAKYMYLICAMDSPAKAASMFLMVTDSAFICVSPEG